MAADFFPPRLRNIFPVTPTTGASSDDPTKLYGEKKTQLVQQGLTIEALDKALTDEVLPSDIDVVRKLVGVDGRKRFDEYTIRFVARRVHWLRRQFDVAVERDVALMVAVLAQVPVFAWKFSEPYEVGNFFAGVTVAALLAADPGAYISYIVDDDAIFSLVGLHYFLLKNQAILGAGSSPVSISAPAPSGAGAGKTARFLQEAIVDIFQNANHLRFNLVKMVELWSQCQTKLHTLTFPLIKCMLATDYADTRPTVAMYDLLLQDALLPTVLLVERVPQK